MRAIEGIYKTGIYLAEDVAAALDSLPVEQSGGSRQGVYLRLDGERAYLFNNEGMFYCDGGRKNLLISTKGGG